MTQSVVCIIITIRTDFPRRKQFIFSSIDGLKGHLPLPHVPSSERLIGAATQQQPTGTSGEAAYSCSVGAAECEWLSVEPMPRSQVPERYDT